MGTFKNAKSFAVAIPVLVFLVLSVLGTVLMDNNDGVKEEESEIVTIVTDNIITEEKEEVIISDESHEVVASTDESDEVVTSTDDTDHKEVSSTQPSILEVKPSKHVTTIKLHKKNHQDNIPFKAMNMFPGDKESQNFNVEVSYKGNVDVHFKIDVNSSDQKLAEVLECEVVLITTGETLYKGLIKEMPESVVHTLSSRKSTVDELSYRITTYLDTSVGSEYMNETLEANFSWWVEDIKQLEPLPDTGYDLYIYLLSALGCVLSIIFLNKGYREEK